MRVWASARAASTNPSTSSSRSASSSSPGEDLVAGLVVEQSLGIQHFLAGSFEEASSEGLETLTPYVKGAFRHRWWNYYERALSYAEGAFHKQALADLDAPVRVPVHSASSQTHP